MVKNASDETSFSRIMRSAFLRTSFELVLAFRAAHDHCCALKIHVCIFIILSLVHMYVYLDFGQQKLKVLNQPDGERLC